MLTSITPCLFKQDSIPTVILVLIIGSTILSCSNDQNSNLNITESSIDIEWRHNSNIEPGNQLSATLSLINEQRLADWSEFANRLGKRELSKLDEIYPRLDYRIPAPGAILRDDMLYTDILLPELALRNELDGSESTNELTEYTVPVAITPDHHPKVAAYNTIGQSGRSVQPAQQTSL